MQTEESRVGGEDARSAQRMKVKEEDDQGKSKRHKKEQEDEKVQWKKDGWREPQFPTGRWGTAASASADEESILTGMMAVVHRMQKELEEVIAQRDRAEKKERRTRGFSRKTSL